MYILTFFSQLQPQEVEVGSELPPDVTIASSGAPTLVDGVARCGTSDDVNTSISNSTLVTRFEAVNEFEPEE